MSEGAEVEGDLEISVQVSADEKSHIRFDSRYGSVFCLSLPSLIPRFFNEVRKGSILSKVESAAENVYIQPSRVFSHPHELDLGYHLSRETGALNRIIDCGSRAINFILSSTVFNIVPTILEISMVSGILAYKFGAPFAWITSLSVAAYIAFTLTVT